MTKEAMKALRETPHYSGRIYTYDFDTETKPYTNDGSHIAARISSDLRFDKSCAAYANFRQMKRERRNV